MSHLTWVSSAIASTTMSQPASSSRSVTTRALATFSAAFSADCSLRAQTTTSWCSAAARASPLAIAPLPTIPS